MPGRLRPTRRPRTDDRKSSPIEARLFRSQDGLTQRTRIDRSLIAAHIRLAVILRALMSGEPTRPKSATEVSAGRKAASGKAGSVPEARPSASEDIAAFVAKAP